ncbi:hypothetical protein D9M68_596990 [compost metagenome]
MALQVGFARQAEQVAIGRVGDDVVGLDAGGLDRTAAGREIARRGELDRGGFGQRQDHLHRALAEAAVAQHLGALVVLQRAGHDLGGRGGTDVHQHDHRHRLGPGRQAGQIVAFAAGVLGRRGQVLVAGIGRAAVGGHHQRIRRQERAGHADGAGQQAARVIAQIQHQALGSFLRAQVLELLGQVGAGLFLELGDTHVADAVVQHLAAHAAHLDDVAHDLQHDGLRTVGAHDGQRDRRLGRAAHQLDRVVERHALGGRVVDLDDEVAGHHASARGGRVFDRRDHLHEAVFGADLDAQAAELALRCRLHFAERVGIQVGGVGIQVRHHAGNGIVDQGLVVDGLDVVVLDGGEHVAQLPEFVQRQGTAALRDRCHAHAKQHTRHRTDGNQTETAKLTSAHAHFPNCVFADGFGIYQRFFTNDTYLPTNTNLLCQPLGRIHRSATMANFKV